MKSVEGLGRESEKTSRGNEGPSLQDALRAASLREHEAAYLRARAEQLLPDLREEARLSMQESQAQQRLARLEEMQGLSAQVRALEARRAEKLGLPAAANPWVVDDTETARIRLQEITQRLTACRTRIAAGEKELRRRFGLAETSGSPNSF